MVNSLFQIEIPRRNQACCKGGERLVPGMEYYSLLLHDEKKAIVRQDFCSSCWPLLDQDRVAIDSQGYWKSHVEIRKETPPQDQTRMGRALSLLKRLAENSDSQEAELFVLSLFLARRRRLALRREVELEGKICQLYEIAGEDLFVTIPKIDISTLDIAAIQESLAQQLNQK